MCAGVRWCVCVHMYVLVCVCIPVCAGVCCCVCVYIYVLVCLLVLYLLGSKADGGREEPLLTGGKNVDSIFI